MTVASTPDEPGAARWAPLADLSRVRLDQPDPDGSVRDALHRVLGSLQDRDGVISSFGSFIAGP